MYGDCQNHMMLKGHSAAVLELCWSRDGEYAFLLFFAILIMILVVCSLYCLLFVRFQATVHSVCRQDGRGLGRRERRTHQTAAPSHLVRAAFIVASSFNHNHAVLVGRFVNSVASSRRGVPLALTGGDDCHVLMWDLRVRKPTSNFTADYQVPRFCAFCMFTHGWLQITAVSFSDDSTQVFAGGIDNTIKACIPHHRVQSHRYCVNA